MEWLIVLVVIFVIIILRTNKNTFNTKTYYSEKNYPVEKAAIPGTFDSSYFINQNNNNFRFPKYRSTKSSIVKIVDETDYREDIWQMLEPQEKKEFDISDFSKHFISADIETDPFLSFFDKRNASYL